MTLKEITQSINFDEDIHGIEGFSHGGNRYAVKYYVDDGKVSDLYLRLPNGQILPIDTVQLSVGYASEDFKSLWLRAERCAFFAYGKHRSIKTAINTKKWGTLISMLLICFTSFAQVNIGGGFGNPGLHASFGFIVKNTDVAVHYRTPTTSAVKPTIYSLEVGKQFYLWSGDDQGLYLAPKAGVAQSNWKEFDADYKENRIRKTTALFGAEAGYRAYMGIAYANLSYTDRLIYSVGMRVLF